jgi:hypothetical protein
MAEPLLHSPVAYSVHGPPQGELSICNVPTPSSPLLIARSRDLVLPVFVSSCIAGLFCGCCVENEPLGCNVEPVRLTPTRVNKARSVCPHHLPLRRIAHFRITFFLRLILRNIAARTRYH